MTNGIIGFLVAIAGATFVFSKLQRSSGGNSKSAAIAAALAGLLLLILALFLLRLIPEAN